MKGDNIAERLKRCAAGIVRLVRKLPRDDAGRLMGDQLLRSGTSPGAHYAEARNAGSVKNFVYKVNLATAELRESIHFLGIVEETEASLRADAPPLMREANELIAMLVASAKTARANSA